MGIVLRLLPSFLAIAVAAILFSVLPERSDKPNIPPSNEVHISPSSSRGLIGSSGPDYLVQRGIDLRAMISRVYEQDPSRIVLPASLDDGKRYDFVVVPPGEIGQDAMYSLVQKGIEKYFRLSAAVESRPMDAYVLTALKGKTPAAISEEEHPANFTAWRRVDSVTVRDVRRGKVIADPRPSTSPSVSFTVVGTMNDFRLALEEEFHRPVVDETNLKGTFNLQGSANDAGELIQTMRDELGLVLTPAQQNIEMLVFRPLP